MKLNTYEKYLIKVSESDYYRGRWDYFSVVMEQAKKINPESVLEIGSGGYPMFLDGTVMDVSSKYNPTVLHDAKKFPWPFANKSFDLFISLQVWEHLGASQVEAFGEVRRVAKKAILSFPYKWKTKDPNDFHNGLDETHFDKWTHSLPAEKILITSGRERIIYTFNEL